MWAFFAFSMTGIVASIVTLWVLSHVAHRVARTCHVAPCLGAYAQHSAAPHMFAHAGADKLSAPNSRSMSAFVPFLYIHAHATPPCTCMHALTRAPPRSVAAYGAMQPRTCSG